MVFGQRNLLVILALVVFASSASATEVQLDLSSVFNYDHVGTANEVTYCNANFGGVHHALSDILGSHISGAIFAGLADSETVAAKGYGLQTDGLVDDGYFKIGVGLDRPFDAADGSVSVRNCRRMKTGYEDPLVSGYRTETITIVLSAEQQAPYANINFLFHGQRSTSTSARYRAYVRVKYLDDPALYTLWSDYHGGGADAGGSFGSAGVDGEGGLFNSTDSDPTWALAGTFEGYYSSVGSPRYSMLYNDATTLNLWKFADNLALDNTKVLEAITLELGSNTGSAANELYLLAATVSDAWAPTADAGADQTIYDDDDDGDHEAILDGSGSEYRGGSIVSHAWSEDGAEIATGVAPLVNFFVGEHDVTLTVTTDDGKTDTDTVHITVEGTLQSFAVAGDDRVVIDGNDDGTETVTLDGSQSGWSTAQWEWREGDTVLGTGETLDVLLPVGMHTITLDAVDISGRADSDEVVIDIRAGAQPPVADAGLDRTFSDANGSGNETVSLDGSDSVDYDGTIVSYRWSEAGAEIAAGAAPRVTLAIGEHVITLTVTDNEGRIGTDTVTIRVVEYAPSPTDEPYVGADEADTVFEQITAADMEIIRSKNVLMTSRSFGGNMWDGVVRLKSVNAMYDMGILRSTDVGSPGSLPDTMFDTLDFYLYFCTYWPLTNRVFQFDDLIRNRVGDDLDAAIIFYHYAEPGLFATYSQMMDSLRLDYPNCKFIYCVSGVSPVAGDVRNVESNQFGDLVLSSYRGQTPIYDMRDILSTHADGTKATFVYDDGLTYRMMCPEFNSGDLVHPNAAFSEERMAKAMIVMLYELFVEQAAQPGDADGDGDVDLDDFVILKTNFGASPLVDLRPDFDNDGDVDLDDFVVLKTNFGS